MEVAIVVAIVVVLIRSFVSYIKRTALIINIHDTSYCSITCHEEQRCNALVHYSVKCCSVA